MAHIRRPASSNGVRLVYIVDENHGESYRSIVPANAMMRMGIRANVIPFQQMHKYKASQWNVFVFRQIYAPLAPLKHITDVIRSMNAKVIWDWDDNPHFHFGASRFSPEKIMELADINTVTTPRLAKVVKNSVVLPNAIDFNHWDFPYKGEKPLTIGVAGGASHMQDWRQIKDPIKDLMKSYDFRFLVVGYLPGYLRELKPEFIEWKHYREYPKSIYEMDIRLSPLDDDEYNLYKSGIAALEAMAVGAVPVVSNHPIYRRVVNNRSNGLIVKDGWYNAIASLLEDKHLRTKLSTTGRKWVKKHRNLDAWIPKWIQAYVEA
jgi:glycosyltransferase involved in cell wall biosynthesis